MKEFYIENNDAGQRLDRFVAKAAPLLPSSLSQKYIRLKRIKVNGKRAERDYKLCFGDRVEMYVNDEFFQKLNVQNAYLKINDPNLNIIFEDDNIMLLNKPQGISCHSDETRDYRTLIAQVMAYLYQTGKWNPSTENSFTPALCNRIDRNTSGIVIAAKNAGALRILNEKIKNHEIDKYYLAAVFGKPNPAQTRLEGYIFKDAVLNRVYVSKNSRPGAKTAIMEYSTISTTDELSLIACKLITGRTHQIRAQMADIGHPLLGDGKYGSEKRNKAYGEKYQALCSYKLTFNFSGESGILEYLNGQSFVILNIDFVKKYFQSIDISQW